MRPLLNKSGNKKYVVAMMGFETLEGEKV